MNDLLLQELNKLVGEQKDVLAARKAEIDWLKAKVDVIERRSSAFEIAVLRALRRLLWECGDKPGEAALERLIQAREIG